MQWRSCARRRSRHGVTGPLGTLAPLAPLAALGTLLSVAGAAAQEPLEVTVAGQGASLRSGRDATAASSVVQGPALQTPGRGLVEALLSAPSVQIQRSGGGGDVATLSLRGTTSAQTPIYLAGVPLNDELTGAADLSRVPVWMLSRVEVFAGASPVELSGDALGGAVLLAPRWPQATGARAGVELGSYGQRAATLGWQASGERAGVLAALRVEGASDDYPYVDDGGTRFVSGQEHTVRRPDAERVLMDLWSLGRWRLASGLDVDSVFNGYRREQRELGSYLHPAQRARSRSDRLLLGQRARVPCARDHAGVERCELQLGVSALRATSSIEDPERELSLVSTRLYSEQQDEQVRAAWRQRLGEGGELLLATTAAETSLSLDGEVTRLRAERQSLGARGALSQRWGAAQGQVLGGVACVSTSADGRSSGCGDATPTGRVGLAYELTSAVTLRGNLQRAARRPTLGELYGLSPLVRGNDALRDETAWGADFGVGWDRRGPLPTALSVVAFALRSRQLIAWRRSSWGVLTPYNVGEARSLGLEGEGRFGPWKGLTASGALTLLDARDDTAQRTLVNDVLPFRSRLQFTAALDYLRRLRDNALGVRAAGAGTRWAYRSSRFADPAGLIVVPASSSWDLYALVRLWRERLQVEASLLDALDAQHFDLLGQPLPGRTWHLAGEVTW